MVCTVLMILIFVDICSGKQKEEERIPRSFRKTVHILPPVLDSQKLIGDKLIALMTRVYYRNLDYLLCLCFNSKPVNDRMKILP